ncbi:putative pentatricopeptide repeat-containing protein At3g23330 [Zingiber officinale]|uniref:putative pentatricopeptide repeat-containing protein At3g23330 n=1 Tax=Zingiber officinale TaxID=94328 RepID=UPI001C4AC822|nr:putative pentatricopeptide repeat-containing protein At3g23330 [Zingiber officinale]
MYGSRGRILDIVLRDGDGWSSPNAFALASRLKSYSVCGDLDFGQQLHGVVRRGLSVLCFVIKSGLEQDEFLCSSPVDMYSKYGLSMEAHKVFIRTIDPDIVVWSAIISCFTQLGLNTGAVELFRTMESIGAKANHRTLASVASAASELGDLALCASLHASILKNGFETGIEVGNAILNMYTKNVAVGDGCVMFDTMLYHDTVSWNCLPLDFTMEMPVIKG